MILLNGSSSTDWNMWICISTIVYTLVTFGLLVATNKSLKRNTLASELNAYLGLRSELTGKLFNLVVKHARGNTLRIDDNATNSDGNEWDNSVKTELKISSYCLSKEVLNNIEDLAFFLDKKILSIEAIDSGYGYPILEIGNNSAIRAYLKQESEGGSKAYAGFADLYQKIYSRLDATDKKKYASQLYDEPVKEKPKAKNTPQE